MTKNEMITVIEACIKQEIFEHRLIEV